MKKHTMLAGLLLVSSAMAFAGGNPLNGKSLVEKKGCVACHGADLNTPIDPAYPRLAGQHADYIEHALIAYQRGEKGANGRGNAIMGGQAKALERQEIKDIAAYLGSLQGQLTTTK